MKKLWILLLFSPFFVFSQTRIEVSEASNKVNGERYQGFKARISATADELEDFLKSEFREKGKTRERNTYYSLTEATFDGDYFGERMFYATIDRGNETQTFWMGVDDSALSEKEIRNIQDMLEDYVYGFCVNFYKHLVQLEIDESIKAQQFTERQIRRLDRDSVQLVTGISDNERELIRLQEAIEANKLEKIVLQQKLVDNKVAQDSTAISLEQIKKVIEALKKKKEGIK